MDPEDKALLHEMRGDIKLILQKLPTYVTWAKLGATLGTLAALIVSIFAIIYS